MVNNNVEKVFCVLELEKTQSVTIVQRRFRQHFQKDPPGRKSIYDWHKKFKNTGSVCKSKTSGRPSLVEDRVEQIRASILRSPKKSTPRISVELQIPQSSVWRILRKRLKMKPYRLQMLQQLRDDDKVKRLAFCVEIQTRFEEDGFIDRLIFGDESTFHISGKVNKHNLRIWGTENPREIVQHERDSPKVNVYCAVSKQKVYGPFFFQEKTVRGTSYLDMVSEWLIPQVEEDSNDYILVQDGAPPHWHLDVRDYLDERLPLRWIGRATDDNESLMRWPPRSPDLTPCDFFLWGYVKDKVFIPPLPLSLLELKQRIIRAIESIEVSTLEKVWAEIDYRIDVCRVTRGAHIEHL